MGSLKLTGSATAYFLGFSEYFSEELWISSYSSNYHYHQEVELWKIIKKWPKIGERWRKSEYNKIQIQKDTVCTVLLYCKKWVIFELKRCKKILEISDWHLWPVILIIFHIGRPGITKKVDRYRRILHSLVGGIWFYAEIFEKNF